MPGRVTGNEADFVLLKCLDAITVKVRKKVLEKHGLEYLESRNLWVKKGFVPKTDAPAKILSTVDSNGDTEMGDAEAEAVENGTNHWNNDWSSNDDWTSGAALNRFNEADAEKYKDELHQSLRSGVTLVLFRIDGKVNDLGDIRRNNVNANKLAFLDMQGVLCANLLNKHSSTSTQPKFQYPVGKVLKLKDSSKKDHDPELTGDAKKSKKDKKRRKEDLIKEEGGAELLLHSDGEKRVKKKSKKDKKNKS